MDEMANRVHGPIIFDIDGSIAVNSSTHLTAFSRAAAEVLGMAVVFESIHETPVLNGQPVSGYIDSECFRLLASSKFVDKREMEESLLRFLFVYESAYLSLLEDGGEVGELIPGAALTLAAMVDHDIPIALSTGNAHFVAREKMKRLGVAEFFDFDASLGFGDRHRDRIEVVRAALSAFPGTSGGMIVGDTARDMEAGILNGITPIGVETGAAGRHELLLAGARVVIHSIAALPGLVLDTKAG